MHLLAFHLSNRSHPIFNVISRRQLPVFYGEYIEGDRFKAPAGWLDAEKVFLWRATCFTEHYDPGSGNPNVLDRPAQVRNHLAHRLEYLGEGLAIEAICQSRTRTVVGIGGLREQR